VRQSLASALVLLLCGSAGGCADRPPAGADAPLTIPPGPDAVLLRLAQEGGVLSAVGYPELTRTLWRSTGRVPSLRAVVAFGAEDGYLAGVTRTGAPVRIDLRLGAVSAELGDTVSAVASIDGAAAFVRTTGGELLRLTPSGGTWRLRPPFPADALLPQADNGLIVAGAREGRVVLWRVRPPGVEVTDSLVVEVDASAGALRQQLAATATTVGDRVLLGAGELVVGVRSRDLQRVLAVDVGGEVRALAVTPSGDRAFALLDDDRRLRIVDRFEEGITGSVRLPAPGRALRMDPLGRMLLVRGPADTVFVVDVGSEALRGVVRSPWREDLPQLFPDGTVATVAGTDVALRHPGSLAVVRTIPGGAGAFWHVLRWNGFRPRAKGLDQPVQFRLPRGTDSLGGEEDSAGTPAPRDSGGAVPPDTLRRDPAVEGRR
jgi:hypothetical protein